MRKQMKNKNILISEELGFIGFHISNKILYYNKVTIIDNLIYMKH